MKHLFGIISLFGLVLICSVVLFASRPVQTMPDTSITGGNTNLPDSLLSFIETACMDCHSNDGSAMARGKLNFSKWSEYDSKKQFEKASESCEKLAKGSMPPKKWRSKHPDLIPTQNQVDMFCRWTKTLPR
jgi:hypothetical protein